MKVYIACPWTERTTAREARRQCIEAGLIVTSRWLDFPGDSVDPIVLQMEALHDTADVRDADVLLLLNLQARGFETSGKAVETGMALAWGKPVYLIGRPSNIFHRHPNVHRVDGDVQAFLREVSPNG